MGRGWIITALVGATAVACIESDVVRCADGRLCAAGSVCDEVNGQCVLPDQLRDCVGKQDGEACFIGAEAAICLNQVCLFPRCGDGLRTAGEMCDRDDLGDQSCLDHSFYAREGLACTDQCEIDTSGCALECGDGVRNGPEHCDGSRPIEECIDFGFEAGHLACDANLCTPDFNTCVRVGWHVVASSLELFGDRLPLVRMHGANAADVWAVGEDGVALHYDGFGWSAVDTGVTSTLLAVWVADNGDAYAAGVAGVLHWDGAAWSAVAGLSGLYTGVWGSSPSDVWVVGAAGAIMRYDGTDWSPVDAGITEDLRSIHGGAADNVWIGDGNSRVYHWDGTNWTPHDVGSLLSVDHLLVFAADDVYAGSQSGELRHWDGVSWQAPVSLAGSARGLFGSGPDDVYSVGQFGAAFRWDGTLWTNVSDTGVTTQFTAGWSSGPGEAYALTESGEVVRLSGTLVEQWDVVAGQTNRSVFSIGRRLLVTGATDGSVRTLVDGALISQSVNGSVNGIWGAAVDDLWLVTGAGEIHHFDGATWTLSASGYAALHAVWGADADNVFAVGAGGVILRNQGAGWSELSSPTSETLRGVWGASATDVFAVGDAGAVVRFQGTRVDPMPFDDWDLDAVWGAGSDDVYAVGTEVFFDINGGHSSARLYHYDGTAWSQLPAPNGQGRTFVTVAGTAPDDVFVAGGDGEMWHYDGVDWAPVALGDERGIFALHAEGSTLTIAGADFSTRQLERLRPWPCPDCP